MSASIKNITLASKDDPGRRDYQQDSHWTGHLTTATQLDVAVAIIADGVGGQEVGQQASNLTVESVKREIAASDDPPDKFYRTLVRAVNAANQQVYDSLKGVSNSTIVVAAIVKDTANNPSEYGRMFIAHVGDSVIYLVRGDRNERRLIRLNVDHTIETEFQLRGEPVENWVYADPRNNPPTSLSRAVGLQPDIQVDIGIYPVQDDSDREFQLAEDAHRGGLKGVKLQRGDTILLSSDGLFGPDPNNPGFSFLRDEEIIARSLNEDVEKTAISLLTDGSKRGLPGTRQDNLSIALMFVPGNRKQPIPIPPWLFPAFIGIVVIAVGVVGALLFQNQQDARGQETQQAIQRVTEDFLVLLNSITDTPQPTREPTETPTPRPTSTPLPTNTPRPTAIQPEQIGILYLNDTTTDIREDQLIDFTSAAGYIAVEGLPERLVSQQANIFIRDGTLISIIDIDTDAGRETFELEVETGSQFFIDMGTFAVGGIQVEFAEYRDLQVGGQAVCLFASEVETTVTFGCLGDAAMCSYDIDSDSESLSTNNILTVERSVNDDTWDTPETRPIVYDDIISYYDLITELGQSIPTCIIEVVDTDGDTVLNADDRCPEDSGAPELEGCPDADDDLVPDIDDACPRVFGRLSNGCPSDRDRDGVIDVVDNCPDVPGDGDNNGCPRDSDRDGVPDVSDACPNEFGTLSNGCPPEPTEPVGSR